MAAIKFDNATLGLGPRDQSAHLPVFLHLRTINLPGPSSIVRSEQEQQRRFERRHNKREPYAETTYLIATPVRQGHASVSPFTPCAVAREPFASQLRLSTALTHGRFASAGAGRDRAESKTGLSSPVPDQQRSFAPDVLFL